MAIFGIIKTEPVIQVDDKIRIDASKSFVSKDESIISLVEIEPEGGNGFIDVTGSSARDYFLDWSYSGTSRSVTVTLRITTDGAPVSFTQTIQVNTEADDMLFSTDADIINKENDILSWVQEGRSSFLNVHRQARDLILTYLDESGYTDNNGARLTAAAIVDTEEVREWSAALTLKLIFKSISNAVDDIFQEKASMYAGQESIHRNRAVLRFDKDGDGEIDRGEGDFSFQSVKVLRR